MNQSPTNEAAMAQSPSVQSPPAPPHLRIVPHLDSPRSLHFEPIDRDVPDQTIIKIGRFTDRVFMANRITFKSKVVSRGHAEIWTEDGKFYIRDTKSSSGTFLNHLRLSPPNEESRPFPLKDGDVIQLGVDYQGGTEEIYRCVKMRLELNRSWQHQLNPYCVNTFQNLRNIMTPPQNSQLDGESSPTAAALVDSSNIEDCCICLYAIAPFQALFVAPCSHSYHYKCIRPLLQNHPGFLCPLCRTYADLEASVAIEASEVIAKFGTRKDSLTPAQAESVAATAAAATTTVTATVTAATVTEDVADNGQDHDLADASISSSARPPASTARSYSPVSDGGVTTAPPDTGNRTVIESTTAIAETLNDAFGLNPQSSSSSSRPIPINTNRGSSSHTTTEHSTVSPTTMVSPVPFFLSNTLLGSPSFSSIPPLPTNGSTSHGHSRSQSNSQNRRDSSSPVVSNQSPTSERQGFGFFSHLTAPLSTVSTSNSATDDEDYMDVGEALSSSPPSVIPLNTERRGSTSGLVGKLKMMSLFEKKKAGPTSPVNTSPVQLNASRVIAPAERSAIPRGREDDQSALASPSSVTSYLTSHDEESSSSSSSDGRPAELEDEEGAGNSHAISSRKRAVKSSKGKAVNVGQIMEGVE